ncbi:hypothetical protein CHLRE_04g218150v5 [Chlamydomonas reinhardtii]|uniref:protein-serine/threonine phosphatase n=1 Tax=Chlamydomonas reinhardtii TaxID=3055 RepID=A0A2K3DU16_CHLRE|nr:uncharacterized protein CHLRE_04g218150v5 [Chlamydomonas reinhardtii]PNW84026.1 hypothetical protein CHLRE_04g218150v5 [Chlamydomonas reinhardtii]
MALASSLLRTRPTHGAIPNAAAAALSLRPAICSGSTSCLQNVLLRRALAGQRLGVTAAAGPSGPSPSSTVVVASELDVGYSSAQGARDTMEDEVQVHYNTVGHYLYAAVFDGHGGDMAAQWLSKELHGQVENCLCGRTVHGSKLPGSSSAAAGNNGNGAASTASAGSMSGTTGSGKGISSSDISAPQLIESFHLADKALLKYLSDSGGEVAAGAGATATVVVIKDDKLVVANVGDSQAVLSRRGNAVILAHYHRVYGSGADVSAEIERVKSVGGWIDDGRVCGVLAVSRAFGDWEFKGEGLPRLLETGIERGYWDSSFAAQQAFSADPVVATPDVTETLLSEEDEFLIVASDGLWDVLPPREAVQWARKEFKAKKDAAEVAASLTGLALKRYSTDNVAVVVVDLQGADFWSCKPKPPIKTVAGRKPGGMFGFLNKK